MKCSSILKNSTYSRWKDHEAKLSRSYSMGMFCGFPAASIEIRIDDRRFHLSFSEEECREIHEHLESFLKSEYINGHRVSASPQD